MEAEVLFVSCVSGFRRRLRDGVKILRLVRYMHFPNVAVWSRRCMELECYVAAGAGGTLRFAATMRLRDTNVDDCHLYPWGIPLMSNLLGFAIQPRTYEIYPRRFWQLARRRGRDLHGVIDIYCLAATVYVGVMPSVIVSGRERLAVAVSRRHRDRCMNCMGVTWCVS